MMGSQSERNGRIVPRRQRVTRQGIVVGAVLGGGTEHRPQPVWLQQAGLQAVAGMLADEIPLIDVLQSPVWTTQASGRLDQRVTDLMEDHLRHFGNSGINQGHVVPCFG